MSFKNIGIPDDTHICMIKNRNIFTYYEEYPNDIASSLYLSDSSLINIGVVKLKVTGINNFHTGGIDLSVEWGNRNMPMCHVLYDLHTNTKVGIIEIIKANNNIYFIMLKIIRRKLLILSLKYMYTHKHLNKLLKLPKSTVRWFIDDVKKSLCKSDLDIKRHRSIYHNLKNYIAINNKTIEILKLKIPEGYLV